MSFADLNDERLLKIVNESDGLFEKSLEMNVREEETSLLRWERDIKEYHRKIIQCKWLSVRAEKSIKEDKETLERIKKLKEKQE